MYLLCVVCFVTFHCVFHYFVFYVPFYSLIFYFVLEREIALRGMKARGRERNAVSA